MCVLGTSTDYDIPLEQLNIESENGKEPERFYREFIIIVNIKINNSRYGEILERNSEAKLTSHVLDVLDLQKDKTYVLTEIKS